MSADEAWFSRTYSEFTGAPPPDDRWVHATEDVEFRYYGTVLDEIVGRGVNIHLECMDTGAWWMHIGTPDGREFMVNLGVERVKSAGDRRDETWRDKHLRNWGFHEEDTDE